MALILVVDDSQEALELMTDFILDLGHSCRLATSGKSAIDLLDVETFDLIISDYQMEDGDGIWLLGELKKRALPPKCIIITGDFSYNASYFFHHNAAGFCYKPVVWENLKKEITRLL
ncbi:MAG: response regulator [Bdellovibrionales bacterium]|nr:response regulator [Bdellovibrionales bacterium]